MSTKRPNLDALVGEAKREELPDVDWDKVEAKLFPRVEREARAQAALGAYAGPKRAWVGAAVVLAAAAALPLFFHRADPGTFDRTDTAVAKKAVAGSMLDKDRNAVVHASARELAKGSAVVEGDVLDVRSGRATFARPDPRGVTWSLEDGAQAEVRAAGETLILALEKGAIEAQVTPVAAGEAFAIDVEGSRVAVHGTHLRVERQGNRAIVDLREGVVSIGAPPKSGSTYGDLVTAPAHVEFDATDPHGTLKVSHEASRVRAAQTLAAPPAETVAASRPIRAPFVPAVTPPAVPATPAAAPTFPSTPPRATTPQAPPSAQMAAAQPSTPAPVSSPVPTPAPPTEVDPDPEHTIIEQVRTCARKHVEHADGIVITVSSRLELRVGDSGMVTSAVFNPPLSPEVQSCAASVIYGTRFGQPGAVSIGIDVTR